MVARSPTWGADPGLLLAAATFHYGGSRFAWQLPGGQLRSPDEMRRLNVWDLNTQTAISTISYYIPSSSFFLAPAFHLLTHLLLYIDEVVMGSLVRYSSCKNIVLFLVPPRGQCILPELLGIISALLMMQFRCNSDLLKTPHSELLARSWKMTMCIIRQLDNKAAPSAHRQEAGWPALTRYSVHRESLFSSLHLTGGGSPPEKNVSMPSHGSH